ncbi:uncharacterized protein LOC119308884 [Triticum dicoccoides]|uniref:uncharacterized protein LOC119308884 n=1 Tax=Triticum dicoccoides TaxID=85692 RepID=UPI0018911D58|nr:uncharacterized protein LOC119308884 [Triticum dicoccoides]
MCDRRKGDTKSVQSPRCARVAEAAGGRTWSEPRVKWQGNAYSARGLCRQRAAGSTQAGAYRLALGARMPKINIVGKEEASGSLYGQLVLGEGVASSLDEQLTKEVQKAASAEKHRIAEEVASLLKLSVDINTTSKSSEKIIATLRAGAEYVGCDVQNCILVAGSKPNVIAAERIGMPCIVVRSSLTARAEFHSARAVMDGFGDTDLTVSKLLSKRWA